MAVANFIAPEHLEIQTADKGTRRHGAQRRGVPGRYAPACSATMSPAEPCAPTNGTARFASA